MKKATLIKYGGKYSLMTILAVIMLGVKCPELISAKDDSSVIIGFLALVATLVVIGGIIAYDIYKFFKK